MRIFIITREPFPVGMAATNRIKAYAKGWKMCGLDCRVIVFRRTEPHGVAPKNTATEGIYEGVPYKYIPSYTQRESSFIMRRLNDYLDRKKLMRYLENTLQPGDVVFEYDRDLRNLPIIDVVHKKGARYIHELCELPFGTVAETAATIASRKKFEKKVLPKTDGVIAISDALADYARKYCSADAKITKIPILVDFPQYDMPHRESEADIPYMFHSGTHYEQKDGFLSMLKAYGKIARDLPFDTRFITTGKLAGSRHENEINAILNEYGIADKVIFTGYLDSDQLKDYLSKASFVVINKPTTQQNTYCFSTKLGEYMAASKPLIITRVGEAMNWLTHGHDAYIIEPDNVEALSKAMKRMFEDKDMRDRFSGGAVRDTGMRSFSIESNTQRLLDAVTAKI